MATRRHEFYDLDLANSIISLLKPFGSRLPSLSKRANTRGNLKDLPRLLRDGASCCRTDIAGLALTKLRRITFPDVLTDAYGVFCVFQVFTLRESPPSHPKTATFAKHTDYQDFWVSFLCLSMQGREKEGR